jgi:general stress protein 26
MSKLTLKDISDAMKSIDICMLTTGKGALVSRPMSNNRDVEYEGDSYFFADGSSDLVQELSADPKTNLAYVDQPALFGKSLYISVSGNAVLVRDKAQIKDHWVPDLDAWFKDGIDTPGLTMIHVKADSVKYWQGGDEGEVKV